MGPAVAIATVIKRVFTHRPAGAHAVLYASGKYNFAFYALVVLSSVISIITAMVVNNMSTQRQYPTY
jgi:CBS-domain-containing membrane protein